jgi:hypothetical protein
VPLAAITAAACREQSAAEHLSAHAFREKQHNKPDMHPTMHGWVAVATQGNNPGCMQGLQQVVQHSSPLAHLLLFDVVTQVALLL